MLNQAHDRVHTAVRPQTGTAYLLQFKLFLAYINWYQLQIDEVDTILSFIEFLAQNGSSAPSLTSYISAMRHFLFMILSPVLESQD